MINLKILFKNSTKYNESIYKEYLKFHEKKYGLKYTLYTIFVIGLLLFCLILQINAHNYSLTLIFCAIITVFLLWRYLHPISEVSKEFKSNKIQKEEKFTFIFYKNNFKVKTTSETYIIKYYQLYKIFETSTFFYLYIDKTHAMLLNKENFTIGSSDDFSKFINKKCWYKFKKETQNLIK